MDFPGPGLPRSHTIEGAADDENLTPPSFSSLQYQITDQPIGTSQQTFVAGGTTSSVNANETTTATGSMQFLKPLATGGVAGITFNLPYTITNLPARQNPSYQPQLQFQFEQPLMQGFGVEINQIRPGHPGSLLNPNILNSTPESEGILISRLRFDQQRSEFERNVNQMLLNVEVAYWNLYGAYWQLYSREQGLRFAYEAFKLSRFRYEAGQVKAADFYQTKGQYELFRAQRVQAISTVLENERQLRALLGLPIEDGTRLMPSDSPTLAPYQPDWKSSLEDCLAKRPELYMARQEVKISQMNLLNAKNQFLPDLRFFSTYDYNGLGGRLDGNTTNPATGVPLNAFRSLASGQFSDWSVGLRLVVPIGFRFAAVAGTPGRVSALARSMDFAPRDQELKAQEFLGRYYAQISVSYENIRANRAQREAFGEQLRARQEEYKAGRGIPGHSAGSTAVLGRRPGQRIRRHRHLQQQPDKLGVRQGLHHAARQRGHRRGRPALLCSSASGGSRARTDGGLRAPRAGQPGPGRRLRFGLVRPGRVSAGSAVGHASAQGRPGSAGDHRAGQEDRSTRSDGGEDGRFLPASSGPAASHAFRRSGPAARRERHPPRQTEFGTAP